MSLVGQVKTWHLEQLAEGSADAVAAREAESAELAHLRKENKRLKEEVEVMRKASAFLRSGRRRHEHEARIHRRPCRRTRRPPDVRRSGRLPQLVLCMAAHGAATR